MAMVGRVDWAKNVRRDDFVRWLDTTNLQFDFEHATHGESRGYGGFYTSNLSLKRAFHREHGLFDEDFRHAIWEDIELGYRLCEQGLDIVYNSLAQAWHDEVVTIERFEKRQELVGYYTELVLRKNPDLLERSESTLDAVRRSRDLLRDTNANERDERFAARLDLAFARGLERAIVLVERAQRLERGAGVVLCHGRHCGGWAARREARSGSGSLPSPPSPVFRPRRNAMPITRPSGTTRCSCITV